MHPFHKACGATHPFRLEVTHQPSGEVVRWTFPQPFVVIGRDEQTDLPLSDKAVSQRHAYLQIIDGRVFCVDLASREGIRWPDGPRPSGWVEPNEALEIGPYRLRLAGDASAGPPAVQPPSDPLNAHTSWQEGLPELELEFVGEGARRKTWLMNRRLALVGRLPLCKVQLSSDSVSRIHCSLVSTPEGIWLVDLLGRRGVSVNGVGTRAARLQDGDRVEVARFQILIRNKSATSQTAETFPVAVRKPKAQKVTRAPACASANAPANFNEMVQVFLLPLASQFCLIQQQMFEQFQEAMKMAHTFSALHERQVDLIRRELDRQAELTRELQALQKELTAARGLSAPAVPAPAPDLANGHDPAPPGPAETPEELSPAAQAPPDPGPAAPPIPPRPFGRKPAFQAPTPEGQPNPAAPPVGGDVHDWLARRIDTIQKERESSWQAIKRVLLGGPPADSVP